MPPKAVNLLQRVNQNDEMNLGLSGIWKKQQKQIKKKKMERVGKLAPANVA